MERALRQHLPGGGFLNVSLIRSAAMSAVRSRGNKTTERRLRLALVRAGIAGWTLRPSGLAGSPDFMFAEAKVLVFVDGCFWHGCPKCGHFPSTRARFWRAKIERNRERDQQTITRLEAAGFRVVRFWEHQLQQDLARCLDQLRAAIRRPAGGTKKSRRRLRRTNKNARSPLPGYP